jgi:hypothetical protein
LKPATPVHDAPPSVLRNRPCGEVPAYHALGSFAWQGVSQNVWSTLRLPPALNAGGFCASVHVRPRSLERNTVGPRWPVRAGREPGAAVARVDHRVVDVVAEEARAADRPAAARGVADERPQAFARGDQERDPAGGGTGGCGHGGFSGEGQKLRPSGPPPQGAGLI